MLAIINKREPYGESPMVNIAIIQRLLNNLESHVNELRTATDITHEKYINDIRLQRFVERTMQIGIDCCFDVIHHIISDKGFREPDSYADAFTVSSTVLCPRVL
jgi:uncharacterized protein YutE (UPF0331/DUF86 family)